MSGRATTTKTKTKTSLRQRGKKDSSVLEKNSDAKTAKEEELEETYEEEGKTFDETVVSSTLFHSAKFEGREKLNFVRELFNRIASNYDFMNLWISLGGTTYWRVRALRKLNLRLHGKVLDVGCGSGVSTRRILKRYSGICVECEGLDPSKEMIRVAKAKSRDARATYTVGNIENCDKMYKTDAFDCVVTVYTCLLYTSPSPRDGLLSRMPSSA